MQPQNPTTTPNAAQPANAAPKPAEQPKKSKAATVWIVILVILTIAGFAFAGYEAYVINQKDTEIASLQSQLNAKNSNVTQLQTELEQLKSKASEVAKDVETAINEFKTTSGVVLIAENGTFTVKNQNGEVVVSDVTLNVDHITSCEVIDTTSKTTKCTVYTKDGTTGWYSYNETTGEFKYGKN